MWLDRAYPIIRAALFRMDAEDAHTFTLRALRTNLVSTCAKPAPDDPALRTTLFGLDFPNPVGLAAGFDKNAEAIAPLLRLGFGFVEVGTITPKPQAGNPRPRIFRDPESRSIINRMGFPGAGMEKAKRNLEAFLSKKPRPAGIVGINIGMNKDQGEPAKDYTLLLQQLGGYADYLTVNVSSPNTPGLRDLQHEDALKFLLDALMRARAAAFPNNPPPILVKLSPDLEDVQIAPLAQILRESGVAGAILTNTTLARPKNLPDRFASEKGGLSGPPLRDRATQTLARFYTETSGRLPLIGVGGISNGLDAFEKIRAGASLVQLYTGMVYEGPGIARTIAHELSDLLRQNGFSTLAAAIGTHSARAAA